jgi:hypothetical protein
MNKVCIVIPYFGKWPTWFDFFLKSCGFNPTISWFFYTDCIIPSKYPPNVKFFHAKLEDFNTLASKKIGLDIKIKKPYKVCDFRPAFGEIFEDFLIDYDFWGWGDIDVIYGDIRFFITDKILSDNEIISTSAVKLFGPLTLLKNTPKINKLYKTGESYKIIFKDQRHRAFDENLGVNTEKVLFVDPKVLSHTALSSFSRIVNEFIFKKEIKVCVVDNKIYMDQNTKNLLVEFNEGNLVNMFDNKKVFFMHFGVLKKHIFVTKRVGNTYLIKTYTKDKTFWGILQFFLRINFGQGTIFFAKS